MQNMLVVVIWGVTVKVFRGVSLDYFSYDGLVMEFEDERNVDEYM